nr:MAG TPA: hypothetical protein [Bacteriophage sp.]
MLFFRNRLYKFWFVCFRIGLYSCSLIIEIMSSSKILCHSSIK